MHMYIHIYICRDIDTMYSCFHFCADRYMCIHILLISHLCVRSLSHVPKTVGTWLPKAPERPHMELKRGSARLWRIQGQARFGKARAPKDLIHIRILQSMISSIPLVLGLGLEPECEILMSAWSFDPVKAGVAGRFAFSFWMARFPARASC